MSEKLVKLIAVSPIGLGNRERAEIGEEFEIEASKAQRLLKKGAATVPDEPKKPEPKRAGRNKADDGGGEG